MCYETHITRHNLNRFHNGYYSVNYLIEERVFNKTKAGL